MDVHEKSNDSLQSVIQNAKGAKDVAAETLGIGKEKIKDVRGNVADVIDRGKQKAKDVKEATNEKASGAAGTIGGNFLI